MQFFKKNWKILFNFDHLYRCTVHINVKVSQSPTDTLIY
jgi:hypothetical protein